MAIDSNSETLISLSDAARSMPARRRGKRPHVSCLYRWTVSGCTGVVLESLQCGGTRCTSRGAMARFFAALTYGADRATVRSPLQRRRAAERAVAPPNAPSRRCYATEFDRPFSRRFLA
jgi:hypothetical protein